jgi:AcrR family transcriptional regulator
MSSADDEPTGGGRPDRPGPPERRAARSQDRDRPGRARHHRDRRDESPAGPEAFWSGYDLLWEEERAGARRSPLDRARIVDAALRVADAEGLDAVTMRRVARELRTGAMSLYRHVPGKEGLVSLMIDKALGESAPPGEPSGDWRNDLRMLASTMWDFIVRHPWYPQAVAERPPVTPRGMAAFEFALSILDHTGLPLNDRGAIVVSITNTVLAAAQNAAAEARARARFQMTDEQIASSVGTLLGDIMAGGAYPRVRDVLTSTDRLEPKEEMQVSVELILDGAAARIAAAT